MGRLGDLDCGNFNDKRRYWHSRRGMLELDLLLMPYAQSDMNEAQSDAYQRLLECEDTELYAWLVKGEPCEDSQLAETIEHVLAFSKAS